MVHGDDQGLILPPRLAPYQVVIVPIFKNDEEKALTFETAKKIREQLVKADVRVKVDEREGQVEPPLHPARVGLDLAVSGLAEADPPQQLVGPLPARLVRQALERGLQAQVLTDLIDAHPRHCEEAGGALRSRTNPDEATQTVIGQCRSGLLRRGLRPAARPGAASSQ